MALKSATGMKNEDVGTVVKHPLTVSVFGTNMVEFSLFHHEVHTHGAFLLNFRAN